MIRSSLASALILAAATVGGAADEAGTLVIPDRANANVSLASSGSFVAAVWSASAPGGQTDIFASSSRDGGVRFSAPVRVNSTVGEASANGEQPPRVALVPRSGDAPQIDVVWLAKRPGRSLILSSRSTDGGRSFATTSVVPGSDAAGIRGWQSIGADGQGNVHAVWLDHRRLAERDSQMTAMQHQVETGSASPTTEIKRDGAAMAELSQLYFSTLGGAPGHPVTGGVCFCCKTAVATGPRGEIYLAWRHVYAGNLRDIAFTSSSDGGRSFAPPVRVSEDQWAIDGCPEDGPVLTVDRQSRVHVVWPTVVSENGEPVKALFHATTRDGRAFSTRVRLPSVGQANHPQMALAGDGSLVLAWDESGDGPRRIALARGRIDQEGKVAIGRVTSASTRTGTYPVLASLPQGAMLAWTAGEPAKSTIRIEAIK